MNADFPLPEIWRAWVMDNLVLILEGVGSNL